VISLDVEIVCSDRGEHRRRVETREPDIAGHRLPTWQDVVDRDYRPWDRERLVIGTATLTTHEARQRILAAMQESPVSCRDELPRAWPFRP
jgi:hypothetical protein